MEVVKFEDAPFYTSSGHDEIVARRLQGGAVSSVDFAMVGHSTFPDRAVIPMEAGTFDKIYVVTEGAITIEQDDGARHILKPGDSIYVPAGEARAVLNECGGPAAMIVVTPSPSQ
jgi:quercetin dioxygenase-like cupin family protein